MRELTLFLALVGIFLWLYRGYKYSWEYSLAPISWLINVSAFRIARLVMDDTTAFDNRFLLNDWSNVIYLHGLFLFIGAAALLLWGNKIIDWVNKIWK